MQSSQSYARELTAKNRLIVRLALPAIRSFNPARKVLNSSSDEVVMSGRSAAAAVECG
jgi:hypothetical protein